MDTKRKQDVMKMLDGMSEKDMDQFIAMLQSYRADKFGGANEAEEGNLTQEERVRLLKAKATEHLRELGVPQHIKGYKYLRHALVAVAQDGSLVEAITKALYPSVAQEFDTTPSRVERAIRHAIEVAWDRGDLEILDQYFGNSISRTKGKPTNSEFIATVGNLMVSELEELGA